MKSFGSMLFLTAFLFAGCSSPIPRFFVRMFSQIADPIESVPNKIVSPILPDVGLSVLWVGHATMLIQIHDKVLITDPIFTNTSGMLAKRIIEPGILPSSLTRVDYILISHVHLDHFSFGSLDMLPKSGKLILPFGGLDYSPEFGFSETRELKTWETLEEDGVKITAVPVRHFAGRYALDTFWMRDRGFTGYVIEDKGKTVFIGGDTGYHAEFFKETGKRFRIDLAILPIAPVEPRDFMGFVHADPKEAVQIFEDLGAKLMIPMHHRTFNQGFDPTPDYAQRLLEDIAEQKGLRERILVLRIGEQRILEN